MGHFSQQRLLEGWEGFPDPEGRYFGAKGLSRTLDTTYSAAVPTDPLIYGSFLGILGLLEVLAPHFRVSLEPA